MVNQGAKWGVIDPTLSVTEHGLGDYKNWNQWYVGDHHNGFSPDGWNFKTELIQDLV